MKPPKISDYPKEVIIKGTTYRIKFIPYQKRPDKNGKRDLGYCDGAEQVIEIMRGQGREETLKTFLHEVFHAFEEEYGFTMNHRLIHRLEEPLFCFLLENL